MTPVTRSQTGVGRSTVFVPNNLANPFNIGVGVVVSGTATYNIEHTFDDIEAASWTPGGGVWFINSGLSAQSANKDGNYAYPIRAISINVTAGTGTVTATFMQAGER